MFVKLGDFLLLHFLKMRLGVLALEDDAQFGDGFLLPLGHQVWVKLMVRRDLGNGFGFFKRFQNDLGLERSGVLFSHERWYPPYFSPFCCPNLWDHYSLHLLQFTLTAIIMSFRTYRSNDQYRKQLFDDRSAIDAA